MKKILIVICALLVFAGMNAQDRSVNLGLNTFSAFVGNASDTVSGSSDTWTIEYVQAGALIHKFNVYLDIDSISGTVGATVYVLGKQFADETLVGVSDTVTWKQEGDTTINLPQATAKRYRYFRVVVASAGTMKAEIQKAEIKFWDN